MPQISKVLKSRDDWKNKAVERATEIREHRKTEKRHLDKIAELKRQCFQQARHAASRNSGTPVAFILSSTQRLGDALNALRPLRLRTKPLRQGYLKWLDGLFGMQFLPSSRAIVLTWFWPVPCPYQGLKIITPVP